MSDLKEMLPLCNGELRAHEQHINCSVRRLLLTANVVPSSPILVAMMMEAVSSSETSVLTRATRRNIPEDAILSDAGSLTFPKWGNGNTYPLRFLTES
jgi:hypothetical protein